MKQNREGILVETLEMVLKDISQKKIKNFWRDLKKKERKSDIKTISILKSMNHKITISEQNAKEYKYAWDKLENKIKKKIKFGLIYDKNKLVSSIRPIKRIKQTQSERNKKRALRKLEWLKFVKYWDLLQKKVSNKELTKGEAILLLLKKSFRINTIVEVDFDLYMSNYKLLLRKYISFMDGEIKQKRLRHEFNLMKSPLIRKKHAKTFIEKEQRRIIIDRYMPVRQIENI